MLASSFIYIHPHRLMLQDMPNDSLSISLSLPLTRACTHLHEQAGLHTILASPLVLSRFLSLLDPPLPLLCRARARAGTRLLSLSCLRARSFSCSCKHGHARINTNSHSQTHECTHEHVWLHSCLFVSCSLTQIHNIHCLALSLTHTRICTCAAIQFCAHVCMRV